MDNIPEEKSALPEKNPSAKNSLPIYKNKFFLGFVTLSFVLAFIVGGFALGRKTAPTPTPSTTATPSSTPAPAEETASWKTYYSSPNTTNCVPLLDDWNNFQCQTGIIPQFSIKYPDSWSLDSTVFHDENDKKIAEFSPGSFALPSGRHCFDRQLQTGAYGSELISESNITYGDYQGKKRVIKTFYEGDGNGVWYPNTYCLESKNNAFVMNFYERNLNSSERELFDKIMSTFKFTNSPDETTNIEAKVKDFYIKWLENPNSNTKTDALLKAGYLTTLAAASIKQSVGFDLPSCSQNPLKPEAYDYTVPVIQGTTASMDVNGTYINDPQTLTIKLGLVKSAEMWKINSFTCPQ